MKSETIDALKVQKYLQTQEIKVLDVDKLNFLGEGKYENLHYCREWEEQYKNSKHKPAEFSINQNGYEEIVRMYIATYLCNVLGYKPEDMELERPFSAGSKSSQPKYMDICVYRPGDRTRMFMAIELKAPDVYEEYKKSSIQDQLFKLVAMAPQETPSVEVENLVYCTAITVGDEFVIKAMVINHDNVKTYDEYTKRADAGISFDSAIPGNYNYINNIVYGAVKEANKEMQPLPSVINSDNSGKLAHELHNKLWGGGSTTDNDIFNFLTKLLLIKIFDEESTPPNEKYRFQIESWANEDGDYQEEDNAILCNRLNSLYADALKHKMYIDEPTQSFIRDEYKPKIKDIVRCLQHYSFTRSKALNDGVDILGQFFETIVSKDFKQSKGQFFTPTEIVKFMVNGLKLDEMVDKKFNNYTLPYVIDPSCGSGTFLIEYMKYVSEYLRETYYKNMGSLSQVQQDNIVEYLGINGNSNKWAKTFIYGTEISQDLGMAVKVNMILHGDGASNIFCGSKKGDGLLPFTTYKRPTKESSALNITGNDDFYMHDINGQFDVILSNPPFSVELSESTQKSIKQNFDLKYKGKNSENIFIERYYQLLKEGGRMAIVLPESCFDSQKSFEMRQFLYKYFNVKAIVSLPILAFEPFTPTKTSILFAEKKTSRQLAMEQEQGKLMDSETIIIEVDDVGYRKTKKQTIDRPNELYSAADKKEIIFKDIDNEKYAIYDLRRIEWGRN